MTRLRRLAAVCCLAFLLAGTPVAYAHPLGNFTVNRYDGLRLWPDHVEDTAVVDTAEIPTAQDRAATDTDHDGLISPAEAAARAATRCGELATAATLSVNGRSVRWELVDSALEYRPGAADLPTARLSCILRAPADLGHAAEVSFASGADPDRLGWKEITAGGHSLALTASDVPAVSGTDELRSYPAGSLDRPLDVRAATIRTAPGADAAPARPAPPPPAPGSGTLFPHLEQRLAALAAADTLTLPVSLVAVALALLLGAGHAALPGHAKLAVAACLAQRRGGVRAALAVGSTVTVTHTAGVLITGLALTASTALAGERLLAWLGAAGGLLITGVGIRLAVTAVRALRGHVRHHHHRHERGTLLGLGLAGGLVPSPSALIVLLGAVALGHALFGVLLVIGYGVGMALALTAAGVLLSGGTALVSGRLPALRRYLPYSAVLTALVVLAVGLGLTLRNLQLL